MKRWDVRILSVAVSSMLLSGSLFAAVSTTSTAAVTAGVNASTAVSAAPAPAAPDMKKISYLLGYHMGLSAKKEGLDVNTETFTEGLRTALAGAPMKYTEADDQASMSAFQTYMENKMMQKQNQLADTNQKASDAFMAKIATEPGVMKITDGLYYKVLTAGTGAIPTAKDTVTVNYEGSLVNGTVFDSSYKRNSPASFGVKQVISGWTQALQKMPVGSTWMLYIAPDLAYGSYAPPVIGPNQALIFKVELLGIKS